MAQAVCQCGKIFKAEAAMQQHQRDSPKHQQQPETSNGPVPTAQVTLTTATTAPVVSETESVPRCSCGQPFKSRGALKQHQRDSPKHQPQPEISSGPVLAAQVTPTITAPKLVKSKTESAPQCSCGRTFNHRYALEQHQRDSPEHQQQPEISKSPVPAAQVTLTTVNIPTPSVSKTESALRCSCGQPFKSRGALEQHQRDSPKHQQSKTSKGPVPSAQVTLATDTPVPITSKTESTPRCSCGQSFKHRQALEQHKRDSPKHKVERPQQPERRDSSPTAIKATASPVSRTFYAFAICSCGEKFDTPEAKTQHQRTSPKHQNQRSTSAASVDSDGDPTFLTSFLERLTMRSTREKSRPSGAEGTARPYTRYPWIHFVKEGESPPAPEPTKKKGGAKKNKSKCGPPYGRSSYSGWDANEDLDWGLCDKECGWCGHCLDNHTWL